MDLSILNNVLLGMIVSLLWLSLSEPFFALRIGIIPSELREEFEKTILKLGGINVGVVILLVMPHRYIGYDKVTEDVLSLLLQLAAIIYLTWFTRHTTWFISSYPYRGLNVPVGSIP